jgi:hypothetical protein
MTLQAIMPGADGADVTAYKRTARQIRAGDYLPDYGGHALTDAVTDPDDGAVWITLDDGRDIRVTVRKVWMHRRYALADWQRDAVQAFRDAVHARNALRESGTIVAAGAVAGTAGADVACYQLSDEEFRMAYPAPRLAEFLRDAAAARRAPEVIAS